MEYEIISGFIDIKHSRRENENLERQFQPPIPNPCSTKRMSPRVIIRNTFYPKHPLAAKLESTACGPAGEFTDT